MMAFFEGAAPPASWSGGVEGLPQPADLTASQEAVRAFGRYKAAVARAVVAVAGEDDNMALLFGGSPEEEISVGATGSKDAGKDAWFIETLKEWMKRDPKERDDLVSCAMLALGNLARKGEFVCDLHIMSGCMGTRNARMRCLTPFPFASADSHCLALVHRHNLAPFSSTLLRRGESDIKVSHGLVGLLKNLSIPAANKPVIGALGVIPAVAPFLRREKDMVQPLQFGTVGLLKHLCAGELDNALRLVLPEQEAGKSQGVNENSAPRVAGDEGTLEALLALTRRTDDVPTRMEGTRVLVNVIKTLWSSSSSPAPSSGATDGVLSQSSSSAVPTDRSDARSRARTRLVRSDVTHALAEMVRGSPKYPVLVNEGVFGLTLVGSTVAGGEFYRIGAEETYGCARSLILALIPRVAPTARLVAHSLLYEPERSPPSSPSPGADGGLPPALPRRRGTADSNASTSSQPPPPPPRSLDMVCNVLARRDARMPPQFAANACALLQAVFAAELSDVGAGGVSQSEANGKGGDEERREKKEGREAIKQLALGSKAALEHLRDEGPQEALEPARKALESLAKVLSA